MIALVDMTKDELRQRVVTLETTIRDAKARMNRLDDILADDELVPREVQAARRAAQVVRDVLDRERRP